MRDSRLLSTLREQSPAPAPLVPALCQASTVLRTLLLAQGVLAVAVMFPTRELGHWVLQYSVLTAGVLPATLLWLVLSCQAMRALQRKPGVGPAHRAMVLIGLGAALGWAAQAMLHALTLIHEAHPVAALCSGSTLAAVVWVWLQSREQRRAPSETLGRLQELQSRIRPHFLFNTLNSAIALVRAEPHKAEQVLEDLSELFRAAIGHSEQSSTLAQELDLARRYLDIEHIRFSERLRVTWELDPQADAARVPALILQPLVENAVRHGVEPSPSGADIRIRTQKKTTHVVIEIANTLPGGAGESGHGMALTNVRERLQLMHDLECQFHHGMVQGEYVARMEVPT